MKIQERQIGLTVFRILTCFLVIRTMFLYFPFSDLVFGVDGLAPYSRYEYMLSEAGLNFLKYPFDDVWTADFYLWAVVIVSFLYCLGIGKWFTGIALYVLILNLQLRNHLVLDGSDNVILVTLPLLILADSYKYFSYNLPAFEFEKSANAVFARQLAAVAIMLQVCIIYFMTGLVKAGCDVWQNGMANYYIMQLDEFMGSKWNLLLIKNAFFVKFTTYATLVFELLFPFFILNRKLKYIALAVGFLFHVGIWVFMKIDVFPWIMISTYFIFITDEEYKRFFQLAKAWLPSLKGFPVKASGATMLVFLLASQTAAIGQVPSPGNLPQVDDIMAAYVQETKTIGMAVGIWANDRASYYLKGNTDVSEGASAITADTPFEIGSITKTFTTLLLAKACLADSSLLQSKLGSELPVINNKSVENLTPLHLATHTSGLPPNPISRLSKGADPTADYPTEVFLEELNRIKLKKKRIGKFNYSNTGMMLLGALLEEHFSSKYSQLLSRSVLMPLGMEDSFVADGTAASTHNPIPTGFDSKGNAVKHWEFNAFAPAGGLYSSISDMLKYLAYCASLDETDDKLFSVWCREKYAIKDTRLALGWFIEPLSDEHALVWHNGGTNGFSSYMGFIPSMNVGVVVLCNSESTPDDMARKVLNLAIKSNLKTVSSNEN